MRRDCFLIAQISDLHCGSPYFDPELLKASVDEILAVRPDLVLVGGDLTAEGYASEFRTAARFLAPVLESDLSTVVIRLLADVGCPATVAHGPSG